MELVFINEAVSRLGVSEVTIRRRLRKGELNGQKRPTPQGFVWLIELPELPDEEVKEEAQDHVSGGVAWGEVRRLEEMVAMLQGQVAAQQNQLESHQQQFESKDRQIGELHVLLQQAQAALPAPKENHHSWWRFWQR